MKFRTPYNFDFSVASNFEEVDPVSVCIPGEAITIKQLLLNYVRGINCDPIAKNPLYADGEPDFDDTDFTRDPMYDLSDVTDRLQRAESVNLVTTEEKVEERVLPVSEPPKPPETGE